MLFASPPCPVHDLPMLLPATTFIIIVVVFVVIVVIASYTNALMVADHAAMITMPSGLRYVRVMAVFAFQAELLALCQFLS